MQTAGLDSLSHRSFGLVVITSVHLQRSLSHLCVVISFTEPVGSCCGLIQSCAFFNFCAFLLKPLFHLLSFFLYFLPSRTGFLQILFAESFDLRRSGSSVYFNLITQLL